MPLRRRRPIKRGPSRLTHYADPEIERLRREVDEEIRRLRHLQLSSDDISDFCEAVEDCVAESLVEGDNITITYDDAAGTITIATTAAAYSDEMARDAIGAALVEGAGIDITVNDGADTITIASTVTAYTDEMARDAIGAALTPGTGIDIDVNDGADTITVTVDIEEIDEWLQLIEVDFAQWTAIDFSAHSDGDTTALDGGSGSLTWTTRSPTNANAGSSTNGGFFRRNNSDVGDDGGNGLRIFHDASVSTGIFGTTQTGPRLTIPLSSLIPDFDPTAEYRIELHVTRFADSSAGTVPAALVGVLGLYQAAGTPTGSAARFAGVGMQRNGANEGAPTVIARTNTRLPITDAAYAYSNDHNVIGVYVGPAQQLMAYSGDYGWPVAVDTRPVGATSESQDNGAISPLLHGDNLLEIGVESNSSATGSVDVMYRRLRVLRKIR